MIKVYTKDNCMQCRMTKQLMDKEHIAYEEIYGDTDEYREMFREMGMQSFPVVIGNDVQWSGFRPDRIKQISPSPKRD